MGSRFSLPLMSLVLGLLLLPAQALAQAHTLEDARRVFAESLTHEEAGRCDQALRGYREVQAVRDTAPVRFRIASCLESLGKVGAAHAAYVRVIDGSQVATPDDAEVGKAGRDAAARLAPRVGRLELLEPAPAGATLTVDGEPWDGQGLLDLEVGSHELRVARGPKKRNFPFMIGASAITRVRPSLDADATHAETAVYRADSASTVWPWVSVGAGAALVGTGVAFLLVREGEVSAVEDLCPGGRCSPALRSRVEAHESRASAFAGAGAVTLVVGGAALAVGTGWLLFNHLSDRRPAAPRTASWSVAPMPGGAAVGYGGVF